ncbi:ABC transporter ATP-binding protein [Paenibacillus albicereus]|uniref:ABC transporter ATP-binding protein n=1 Tax=Paenibacillus albicereus TaxID=2726185 RepID=A0A6H2GSC3_9BACL|nr:ABC transporter ATP-binding protein [Paenibacillus albicereus]QJC50297.1 ABC transporter ATP-binding protein [Paenibacillus albicereus]
MKLVLEQISKTFDSKPVLREVSYTFEKGKIYGLLGRNGAGKTTLFNSLSRELKMDGGEAYLEEDGIRRPLRETDVGYVYSLPILPEFLTGYEFVKFYLEANPQRREGAADIDIDAWFDRMRIDAQDRHRLIKGYSHGMKNKVQMLLFFLADPPVILLDEPLTSFDVIVALEMKQMLREMKQDHILIFSTHILQLATDLCDELVVLNQGSLSSVPSELLRSPEFEQEVARLLQDGSADE